MIRSANHSALLNHLEGDREFADSPLEEDGFEPSVPLGREVLERSNISTRWVLLRGGTEGSNPSSSSGESYKPRSLRQFRPPRIVGPTVRIPVPPLASQTTITLSRLI